MTVWFAARRIRPDAVGGIEAWSREVRRLLGELAPFEDVSHLGAKWREPAYLLGLRRRLSEVAPGDTVDGSDASIAIGLPRHPGRSVVRAHGLDLLHRSGVYQALLARALAKVDTWVANSHATKDLLLARGQEDVRVVHPPALGQYGPGHETGRLLMVGRLVRRKGFATFIEEQWPRLARAGYRLDIVGDGPDRARVQRSLRGAPGDAVWHGRLAGSALEALWRRADVMVMPNQQIDGDFEGFGMVAAESAVRGVPVVASAVDGIPDAVKDGQTGSLVDPDGDWSKAIGDWSGLSVQRRKSLARRAQACFGPERHAEEYLEVLHHGSETRR